MPPLEEAGAIELATSATFDRNYVEMTLNDRFARRMQSEGRLLRKEDSVEAMNSARAGRACAYKMDSVDMFAI